jgi:hypothetical protein
MTLEFFIIDIKTSRCFDALKEEAVPCFLLNFNEILRSSENQK